MKRLIFALLLFCATSPRFDLQASPPQQSHKAEPEPAPAATITVPPNVNGLVGRLVTVSAQTPGKKVIWQVASGPDRLDTLTLEDGHKLVVVSPTAGTYTLYCWSAVGGEPTPAATCTIELSAAKPVPPPIPPGPKPPPAPVPDPEPVDAFYQSLKAAYQADTDPQKSAYLPSLAQVYSTMATDGVLRPAFKTTGDILAAAQAARKAVVPDAALMSVRKAIAADADSTLPRVPSTSLTPAVRAQIAAEFAKVADYLGRIK